MKTHPTAHRCCRDWRVPELPCGLVPISAPFDPPSRSSARPSSRSDRPRASSSRISVDRFWPARGNSWPSSRRPRPLVPDAAQPSPPSCVPNRGWSSKAAGSPSLRRRFSRDLRLNELALESSAWLASPGVDYRDDVRLRRLKNVTIRSCSNVPEHQLRSPAYVIREF